MLKYALIIILIITTSYAKANVQQCNQYLSQRDQDNAIKCVEALIAYSPSDANLYIFKATIYSSFNNPQLAIEAFNKAVQIDPSNIKAYSLRGSVFMYLDRYSDAAQDFSSVIALDKRINQLFSASVFQQRGAIYQRMNLYTKAIEDYTQAAKILEQITDQPQEKNAILFDAYAGNCSCNIIMQDYISAINACQKANHITPNVHSVIVNLSSAYIEMKKYHDAISIIEQMNATILEQSFYANYNMAIANKKLLEETKEEKYQLRYNKYLKFAQNLAKTPQQHKLFQ